MIHEPAVFRVHADLIEALIGTGDLERAETLLVELEERGRTHPFPWSLAMGARCRGLLLAAQRRRSTARRARSTRRCASTSDLPMPFELGRTLLVLGLLQRRRNERRLAHESLEQALAIFTSSGRRSGRPARAASCGRSAGARRAAWR